MITGSAGSSDWAANLEVKCLDLTANPYLLLAGLLAAGLDGVAGGKRLPEPVDVDPAALAPDELEQTRHSAAADDLAGVDRCTRRRPGAARCAWAGASRLGAGRPRVGDRAVRRGLA